MENSFIKTSLYWVILTKVCDHKKESQKCYIIFNTPKPSIFGFSLRWRKLKAGYIRLQRYKG